MGKWGNGENGGRYDFRDGFDIIFKKIKIKIYG